MAYPYWRVKDIQLINKVLDEQLKYYRLPAGSCGYEYEIPTNYGPYRFSLDRYLKRNRLYGLHGRFATTNQLTGNLNSKWNHYWCNDWTPQEVILKIGLLFKEIGFELP